MDYPFPPRPPPPPPGIATAAPPRPAPGIPPAGKPVDDDEVVVRRTTSSPALIPLLIYTRESPCNPTVTRTCLPASVGFAGFKVTV